MVLGRKNSVYLVLYKMKSVKRFYSNKIVLYMSTRYLTYILTFLVNMFLALKMGPENYGVWSFLMLVFWYFNIIDLGVPNAVQVLLVQNKTNPTKLANIEKNGNILIFYISLSCFIVSIVFLCGGIPKANSLNLGWLFVGICICAFFNYYNNLYDRIYRFENRLFELAYKQTSVVFLMAIPVFFLHGRNLLVALVWSYIIWCVSSFLLFIYRGCLNFSGKFEKDISRHILHKGIFLFFFYSGFSLIIISTKTIVSSYYSLEEFGLFSFAYYLGHAVYNCLIAFSTIAITKMLDRFHSPDRSVVLSTISIVRENYVSLFHGIIYIAMIAFPFVLHYMPQYSDSIVCMNLCALMMLLYANALGYSTHLVAVNKEKKLAFIAISALFINIVLGLLLVLLLHVSYTIIVISTMISYFYYAFMCTYYGRKELGISVSFGHVMFDCFPVGLLIPFVAAICITFLNIPILMIVPTILFVILNKKTIKSIVLTIQKLLKNPNLIDI